MAALNLRASNLIYPGFLYSGSVALTFDNGIFTDILSLYNPVGSGKTAYIIAATFSARADGSTRNMTLNFSRGVRTLAGTVVTPSKLDTTTPANATELNYGGTWIIGSLIESRTMSAPTDSLDIGIVSPIILHQGEGVLFYTQSESGGQTLIPSASIVWYEV